MLTGEKLTVFESFKVDRKLPKYKDSQQNSHISYDDSTFTVRGNTVIRGDGLIEEFTEASISYSFFTMTRMI